MFVPLNVSRLCLAVSEDAIIVHKIMHLCPFHIDVRLLIFILSVYTLLFHRLKRFLLMVQTEEVSHGFLVLV